MGKPYYLDLRERICAYVAEGNSARSAERLFGVSAATAVQLAAKHREYGTAEVHCNSGMDVVSACRTAGVSDKTYYGWRRKYGGMDPSHMAEFRETRAELQRLKPMYADLAMENELIKEALGKSKQAIFAP